ncbi:MAG: hypothetical protein AB1486_17235 [Planctomycetota bacterium]
MVTIFRRTSLVLHVAILGVLFSSNALASSGVATAGGASGGGWETAAPAPRPKAPHDRFTPQDAASWYLSENGLTGLPQAEISLEKALGQAYVVLPLGLYDLRYPRRFLADNDHAKEFQQISIALIDLQQMWRAWLQGKQVIAGSKRPGAVPQIDPDAGQLRSWIESWKTQQLGKERGATGEPMTVFELLGAEEGTLGAAGRFQGTMLSGEALFRPTGANRLEPVRVVFAPTRQEFLGFASFVGSLGDDQRRLLWVDTLPVWTEFRWGNLLALALEYATPNWREGNVAAGMSMTAREKTGTRQHVLQHAAERLIRACSGGCLDAAIEAGLEVKIVIDILGENNARAGGSGESRSTEARSRFVPGYTRGGFLPPINADSRWRTDKGRDYFVKALQKGQADGEKAATRLRIEPHLRGAHFALDSAAGEHGHCVVTAPFLGLTVGDKSIGDECASDYREFFRAYSVAFVYWMQHHSGKRFGYDSEPAFARLLAACAGASAESQVTFGARVEAIYAVPLSSPDPSVAGLEWRFLEWLAKG